MLTYLALGTASYGWAFYELNYGAASRTGMAGKDSFLIGLTLAPALIALVLSVIAKPIRSFLLTPGSFGDDFKRMWTALIICFIMPSIMAAATQWAFSPFN
jgi:hypothetical protein